MTKVGRAVEKGETEGFMKVLVDAETKQLLGASILEPAETKPSTVSWTPCTLRPHTPPYSGQCISIPPSPSSYQPCWETSNRYPEGQRKIIDKPGICYKVALLHLS